MASMSRLMDFTGKITREVGGALLSASGSPGSVTEKTSRTDIATEVDARVESDIVARIRTVFPDDAIYGEEGARVSGSSERRWIIDPLDGTSNFVRGLWPSVVSIGVEVGGRLAVGAVFDPWHDELYTAASGQGAYRNGLRISRAGTADQAMVAARAFVGLSGSNRPGRRELRAELLARLALSVDSVRDIGSSALHLCYAADGRFDAHIGMDVQLWDIAAGLVIAREAGCVVTGYAEGDDASADSALVAVPSLVAPLRAIIASSRQAT